MDELFRNFNPLPRKEGDWQLSTHHQQTLNFNPLPRKEGDVSRPIARKGNKKYFNPLPRKEGDRKFR